MKMPKKIASWCMVLFFLVYGVTAFVHIPSSGMILAFLALGTALFTFLDK